MYSTETLVWAMFAAVMVAVLYTFAMQNTLALLVKRLIDKNAVNEASALTLKELGYKNRVVSLMTEYFVKGGSAVARAVVKIGGEKKKTENPDLLFVEKTPLKLYLPEENITKNIKKHISEQISYPKLAAAILVLVLAAFAASSVIDFLGRYAYGLIDGGGSEVSGVTSDDSSLLEEQEELNRREEEMKKLEEELAESEKEAEDNKSEADEVATETDENDETEAESEVSEMQADTDGSNNEETESGVEEVTDNAETTEEDSVSPSESSFVEDEEETADADSEPMVWA